jgi:GGDEF domain-containing protein
MMVVLAERAEHAEGAARAPGTHNQGDQRRDLALVEVADDLRRLAGPAALLARLGHSGFGLAVLDTLAEPLEEIGARLRTAAADGRLAFGSAVFDPQQPVSLDALLDQAAPNLRPKGGHAAA